MKIFKPKSSNTLRRQFRKYLQELVGTMLSREIQGLYFLIHKNELLYIGSTNNLIGRLGQHCLDKEYDTVLFIECMSVDRTALYTVEGSFISQYKPRLNFENRDKLANNSPPIPIKHLRTALRELKPIKH